MTKRLNKTRTANLTLGGITVGFMLSYPFHGSFVGGLISSGCSAGMIGGLADWFAVTALFRRPLGIRPGKVIRTEIIPQNRERIFAALAAMVQNELLSPEVLRRKLAAWDFSGVFLRILVNKEIKHSVGLLLARLTEDLVQYLGQEESARLMLGFLPENLGNLNLPQTLAEVIEFSLNHGDVDLILTGLCRVIADYVEQPEVKAALMDMIEAALARYGENNPTRKMVVKFLPAPAVLAHGLQVKLKTVLQDGTAERWFKDSLLRWVSELKTNVALQDSLNRSIFNLVTKSLDQEYRAGEKENTAAILEHLSTDLRTNWDQYLGALEHNNSLRAKVDRKVKLILERQLELHHDAIGHMVREGLDPLTDDKLVELVEDKAGNDLQMIRINGSIVGGLAGMLIYVLGMVFK